MKEMIKNHFSDFKGFSKRVDGLVDKQIEKMAKDHRKKVDKCDFPVAERASDERYFVIFSCHISKVR